MVREFAPKQSSAFVMIDGAARYYLTQIIICLIRPLREYISEFKFLKSISRQYYSLYPKKVKKALDNSTGAGFNVEA